MSLYAAVVGVGIMGFLSLYAAFSISQNRVMEKGLLYVLGLTPLIVIPFLLFGDSLDSVSLIQHLSGFFEKYFILMIVSFFAVLITFMLSILLPLFEGFGGNKDE